MDAIVRSVAHDVEPVERRERHLRRSRCCSDQLVGIATPPAADAEGVVVVVTTLDNQGCIRCFEISSGACVRFNGCNRWCGRRCCIKRVDDCDCLGTGVVEA